MNVDIVGYSMEWWIGVIIAADCIVPVVLIVCGVLLARKVRKKNTAAEKEKENT